MALLAVGGYGRRELCPASDLDLVLLHDGRTDIGTVADRVWYPIWDAGRRLDHSVRTPKEVLAVAEDDLKAALGLLDARVVAGDAALAAAVVAKARVLWEKRARRFLPKLMEQVADRQRSFGEVAFLLEPDIKEAHGGLRDLHAVRCAALASPVVPDGAAPLQVAHDVLLRVRIALHARTGRPLDRLLLEEQDSVADDLGYPDADALMQAVASAARAVSWYVDDAWDRVRSWLAGPRRRAGGRDRPLGRDLVLRDGEIALAATADLDEPSLPLRAAAAAAEAGVPLARATLERLATEAPPPSDPWPAATRDALVALLGTGRGAVPLLEALDFAGLLVRLLPEWEHVRSRPQRNAYHRFTVDRHLCEAAANAAALTRSVARPDLLLVGTWLHDIGKGFPGDHTEAGIEVVAKVAARMGFPPDDVAVLVAMVRHHLLLPDVATRRDLADPRTVRAVADAVGSAELLDLLAALTEADSMATGPAAWSDWKAELVAELVARTRRVLNGGGHAHGDAGAAFPTAAQRERMADGVVAIEVAPAAGNGGGGAGGSVLTVIAPDRPGVFARVAGTLAVHGLEIRSAAAASEDGMAIEVFDVVPSFDTEPRWDQLRRDLERVLAGRLSLESRLGDRIRAYGSRPRSAQAARPAEARVLFDHDASDAATVIEVRAPDGIAVLYRITRALADCHLDIRSAKVSTLGHEVVDAFYVTDADGAKITDADYEDEIAQTVLAELHRG